MPGTLMHLTPDELRQWIEHHAVEDRARVLTHLAGCEPCRAALADLVRNQPSLVSSAEAAPHGYAAYTRMRPAQTIGWLRTYAAAAVIVLAAAAGTWWAFEQRRAEEPIDLRGTTIQAIAPSGRVRGPIEFRWSSPYDAASYRLRIRDGSGTVLAAVSSVTDRARLPPALRDQLRPGQTYAWTVEALDRHGDVIAGSETRTFTIEE
jgi:hypothetical protein